MKNNMERLVKELQERFGEEYEVVSVKVPKNNEVLDRPPGQPPHP